VTAASGTPGVVRVYWRPGCPYCMMLQRKLHRARLPVEEINIWEDPAAAAEVRDITGGDETVPTVIVGTRKMVNPSARQVIAAVRAEYPSILPADPARPESWLARMACLIAADGPLTRPVGPRHTEGVVDRPPSTGPGRRGSMQVEVSPEAAALVGERGGRVWVWAARPRRCCQGTPAYMHAATERPAGLSGFRLVSQAGVEIWFRAAAGREGRRFDPAPDHQFCNVISSFGQLGEPKWGPPST